MPSTPSAQPQSCSGPGTIRTQGLWSDQRENYTTQNQSLPGLCKSALTSVAGRLREQREQALSSQLPPVVLPRLPEANKHHYNNAIQHTFSQFNILRVGSGDRVKDMYRARQGATRPKVEPGACLCNCVISLGQASVPFTLTTRSIPRYLQMPCVCCYNKCSIRCMHDAL